MPSNPFKSKAGKAPKADPRVDKVSDDLIREGPKVMERGERVQTWINNFDAGRMKRLNPTFDAVDNAGAALNAQGLNSHATFNADYQPVMDLQAMDAMGTSWLSVDQQRAQVDQLLASKLQEPGLTSAQKRQMKKNASTEKRSINAAAGAERAAVGMATGDAAQAERRNMDAITTEAGQMGVDPSRIMATRAATRSDSTAAAVDAAQRARFGVRDQRSKNLATTANTGLQLLNQGDSEIQSGAGVRSANVSNVNQTYHDVVGDRSASLPYTALGLQTIKGGGDLALGKTSANQNAANINGGRDDGFMSAVGTGVGLWASSGFAT